MGKIEDLTGQRFGRLTVIKRAENHVQPSGKHYIQWLCKCDCGKETVVRAIHLKKGHTKSCGCLAKEKVTKHGGKHTRLYTIWRDIKIRCFNSNDINYKNYGGKGILMCDEWKNNFKTFQDWSLNNGYDENAKRSECTIDRIDNTKGYYPDNCRWVDNITQQNNKRNNRFLTYKGETCTVAQWSRKVNIALYVLYARLKKGWSVEKALITPVKEYKK